MIVTYYILTGPDLYASSEHGKCPCTTFTSAPTIWYNKTSSQRAIDDDDHLASEP